MIKVKLLEYTPNPEHVVAMAARLCYSSAGAEELAEKISDEKGRLPRQRFSAAQPPNANSYPTTASPP